MNMPSPTRFLWLLVLMAVCVSRDSPLSAQQSSDKNNSKDTPKKTDSADDPEPERRIIRILGDTKLDVRQWPLLGKPNAKYVFVEMYDYTCPHCRDMHHEIEAAFKKFGDDLAVLTLPVPLNATCNDQVGRTESQHREACDIANLAVIVWKLKPKEYHDYHDWLFESERARTAAAARERAVKIVGAEPLRKALEKKVPQKFIARHVKLYAKAGAGSIPKMLFSNITLVGNVGSAKLCETIERELGQP
jgi:protein-disulfide isomerase